MAAREPLLADAVGERRTAVVEVEVCFSTAPLDSTSTTSAAVGDEPDELHRADRAPR